MSRYYWLLFGMLSGGIFSCAPKLPEDVAAAYQNLPAELDYNLHVKPILSDKCFACHGPDKAKQKAGLRLDIADFAFASLPENPSKVAIDPGDLEDSEVFHRILSADPDYVMPTPDSHLQLTTQEKAILIKWIEDGAEYKPHWAFVAPEEPDVPDVKNEDWVKNPIDNFILKKLEQEQLKPATMADKETLLRRLSLDLTGLPPTLPEIDAFLKDNSPNAYEKQVNRLLASPHYGEKMAVDWLDLARFADSHGYTVDRLRDMSPYRDWVIGAFNQNMPYDKFIHWQLAGDLMPKPSKEMLIATAFNRNHQQNMEGGIIEEEFQTEYVVDRTNTFGDAFLGLSVGCAKCHDHKYDPISQKNYYELFSFFNNVKEAGQISWDDAMPSPTLLLPTAQQEKVLHFINTQIKQQEATVAKTQATFSNSFNQWIASKGYQNLGKQPLPAVGLIAHFDFENGLKNNLAPRQMGRMLRETGEETATFTNRGQGKTLSLNGDVWLDLDCVGGYRKSQPFSVGIWVNVPKNLKEGVIIHKSQAERLYNFRGWHLYLKNNKLELNMAHTAPSDAITRVSTQSIPRDKWIQLTITYDGSSLAKGLRLYLDGNEMPMETTMDQLQKDILFKSREQSGIQVGGWWRGWGFTDGQIDDITFYDRVLTPYELKVLAQKANWNAITQKTPAQLSAPELTILKGYYLSALEPNTLMACQKLQQLRSNLADSTAKIKELMVMQEMPQRKKAHILLRGNYDALGEEVFPNTPENILAFPKNFPKNRYGLAQWLTHEHNPLTARVAVNRLWQNFFGTGLVKTTEDFGNQGELPSHLELLDYLAISFRQNNWDIKHLNKLIVMSATYQQDSRPTREAREKDPENRWLSHGPANRMTAEMIRDNALAASGLLNPKIGGESVKPYQPDGLWQINSANYVADSGDKVYRRSLYILAKRAVPNPTLATFDATSRSFCVVRRQKTNTPLQALVTLNDPTFVEVAKVIGEQMTRMPDSKQAIDIVYRKLTGRRPSSKELGLLVQLRESQLQKFKANPAKVNGWLQAGQYKIDTNLEAPLVAANAVVASTILNSDASITKR